MAKSYQLRILEQGIDAWNAWREEHPEIQPDLSRAYLNRVDLRNANLSRVDFRFAFLNHCKMDGANLIEANLNDALLKSASLRNADLSHASLRRANLNYARFTQASLRHVNMAEASCIHTDFSAIDGTSAYLNLATLDHATIAHADLSSASLCHISLHHADLSETSLDSADMSHAIISDTSLQDTSLHRVRLIEAMLSNIKPIRTVFEGAELSDTVMTNVDFSQTLGLSDCIHRGPSFLDEQTLENTRTLPEKFLRGTELPSERILDYLYRFSLTITFNKTRWIPLIPVDAILAPTVEGKYLAEQKSDSILIRLRSAIQIRGVLNAVVPVIAALYATDPSAVISMEVTLDTEDTFAMPSDVFKNALAAVHGLLSKQPVSYAYEYVTRSNGNAQPGTHPMLLMDDPLQDWFSAHCHFNAPDIHPHSQSLYDHFIQIFDRLNAILALGESNAVRMEQQET